MSMIEWAEKKSYLYFLDLWSVYLFDNQLGNAVAFLHCYG